MALQSVRAALRRSGSVDCPLTLSGDRWVRGNPADGGCRSDPASRVRAAGGNAGAAVQLGAALSRRRISPPAIAQPVLPVAVFRRREPAPYRADLRLRTA